MLAILGRHRAARSRTPLLDRVLLTPTSGVFVDASTRQSAVHLAPHLHLTVLRPIAGGLPAPPPTGSTVPPRLQTLVRRLAAAPDAANREIREFHRRTDVHRWSERVHRLETVLRKRHTEIVTVTRAGGAEADSRPAVAEADAAPRSILPVRPVPRVVHRPAAAAIPSPVATTSGSFPVPGAPRPPSASSTSPEPAPVDVRRLTDQVVDAIDRRILAHRERLGRI